MVYCKWASSFTKFSFLSPSFGHLLDEEIWQICRHSSANSSTACSQSYRTFLSKMQKALAGPVWPLASATIADAGRPPQCTHFSRQNGDAARRVRKTEQTLRKKKGPKELTFEKQIPNQVTWSKPWHNFWQHKQATLLEDVTSKKITLKVWSWQEKSSNSSPCLKHFWKFPPAAVFWFACKW